MVWVECLAPVDLWEVDLKDELQLELKVSGHVVFHKLLGHTDTHTQPHCEVQKLHMLVRGQFENLERVPKGTLKHQIHKNRAVLILMTRPTGKDLPCHSTPYYCPEFFTVIKQTNQKWGEIISFPHFFSHTNNSKNL